MFLYPYCLSYFEILSIDDLDGKRMHLIYKRWQDHGNIRVFHKNHHIQKISPR